VPDELRINFERVKTDDSNYLWVNLDRGTSRVGTARIRRVYRTVIIRNINIFPEFERKGYAAHTAGLFKGMA